MACRTTWAVVILTVALTSSIALASPPADGDAARARTLLSGLPLTFVENRGQVDGPVAYYAQGHETALYLTPQGLTFALSRGGIPPEEGWQGPPQTGRWVVKLDLLDAKPVTPVGKDRAETRVSYFKGPKSEWRTGLATFGSVVYPGVWPGIDLEVSGTASRLKSTFIVRPGADPKRIRLAYRGADSVKLTAAGGLDIGTPLGGIEEERPYAYQQIAGRRVEVAAAFALAAKDGETEYGFTLGEYDPTVELVLDPATLVYCGYIGGASGYIGGISSDESHSIAVDAAGNAYVTGYTYSTDATFPVTAGPDLTFNGGYEDAFVAKVRADGSTLDYCGYIGGSGEDSGNGIAVDSAGDAYVTGLTRSTEGSFPVTVGPDITFNGVGDAFVAKVRADGSSLDYCGYIGGADAELGMDVAIDAAGSAYVTGRTYTTEATFPVTVGPDLTFNGYWDAFVAKVRSDGAALDYCGYIGGLEPETAYAIAVDGAGNAYVTGYTASNEATFPVTIGPDLTFNGSFNDAFVAKVRADGTTLDYCGYIGGSGDDEGSGIAVDGAGSAFVTGLTFSNQASFPVTVGPDLTFNGFDDAFVAKVMGDGGGLEYCGYIGGADEDHGYAIAVDGAGNAYVTGVTGSSEGSFPVTVGPDLTHNSGMYDAFVAKVRADGSSLDYCGYIGGSSYDAGYGIAVDSAGTAYVTGWTASSQATFPVTVGPDLTYNGGGDYGDAFVAMVAANPVISPDLFIDGFETGDLSGWSDVSESEQITVLLPGSIPLVIARVEVRTLGSYPPLDMISFSMGSPSSERGRLADEGPQHTVYLTRDYYLGKYEVTQAQWQAVTGLTPPTSCGVGPNLPVCDVTWEQVAGPGGFVELLNAYLTATGQPGAGMYRLPTEAEWEYAARAGTVTRFSHGDVLECGDLCDPCPAHDAAMWWCGNDSGSAQPVGSKLPNAYGLYDMHGNVWEWVNDWYSAYLEGERWNPAGPLSGTEKLARGGAWDSYAKDCRSARRYAFAPTTSSPSGGFRLARLR